MSEVVPFNSESFLSLYSALFFLGHLLLLGPGTDCPYSSNWRSKPFFHLVEKLPLQTPQLVVEDESGPYYLLHGKQYGNALSFEVRPVPSLVKTLRDGP